MRKMTAVLAALVAVTLSLAGCGGSDEPEAISTPTTSPSTDTASTSSPSPSPTATMSERRKAVEAALDRYLQVETQLYADPNANIAALDDVSYGLGRSQAEDYLMQTREQGLVGIGPRKVLRRTVTRDKRDDPPTFIVEQCLDVSEVEVTKNGEPFEGPSTERNLTTYGVSFWEDKWQISYVELNGPNQC